MPKKTRNSYKVTELESEIELGSTHGSSEFFKPATSLPAPSTSVPLVPAGQGQTCENQKYRVAQVLELEDMDFFPKLSSRVA